MASGRAKRLFTYIPPSLYVAFVFVISVRRSPEEIYTFWQADKLYHFICYSIMGFLWARALTKDSMQRGKELHRNRIFVFAVTISFVYGVLLEFVQYFLPARDAELMDALANGLGGVCGAFVYRFLFLK